MKTRITALAAAGVFLLGTICLAQAKTPAGAKKPGAPQAGQFGAPEPGRQIATELGLSKEQTTKITDIVRKFHTDARGIMASNITDAQKKSKHDALKAKASKDIFAVLTPSQQTKAKQTGCIERLLTPRRPGGYGFAGVLGQLNLTAQQQNSINAILEKSRADNRALMENKSLTPEQKRAKALEARKATTLKIEAVLNADQKAKFRKLMAEQPKPDANPRRPRK